MSWTEPPTSPPTISVTWWRYHFRTPVCGQDFVDRPFDPIPRISQPGGPDFVTANVPRGNSEPPVDIPWENITYVERLSAKEVT